MLALFPRITSFHFNILLFKCAVMCLLAIPIGRVHFPVAFSSSSKMVMIGISFCLLSSLEMKPLSSWERTKSTITHNLNTMFNYFICIISMDTVYSILKENNISSIKKDAHTYVYTNSKHFYTVTEVASPWVLLWHLYQSCNICAILI